MKFSKHSPLRRVIVHADDYGISAQQSHRILSCARDGALNSLSVLVTSPAFKECADMLRAYQAERARGAVAQGAGVPSSGECWPESADDELLVGLHVNLVEGRCAADPPLVPLLASSDGMFKRGFAGLLAASALHPRSMRVQVSAEVLAQIQLFCEEFPGRARRLRVDSHQHFHMIPAVFDGLVNAIGESGCELEYMRIPAEPLVPYARAGALRLVPPVNMVKSAVLNVLWRANRRKVPGIESRSAVFCGVKLSGRMTLERVNAVLGSLQDFAQERGMPLELLFHPGGVRDASECLNPALAGFVSFYTSNNRHEEAQAVKNLNLSQHDT